MSTATDRRDTIDTPPAGGSLRGMIQRALRKHDLDLRVAAPATVVTYTPATQVARCTLGFLRISSQTSPAGEVEVPLPPELVDARVAVAQGATHSDHLPIAPGDTGLLIFADRALDQWYRAKPVAGVVPPVDPAIGRAHDQADAVFFPGLAPDAKRALPPSPALAAARVIDAPTIALGAAATPASFVAVAPLLQTYLQGLIAAMTAGSVALDGGTAALAAGSAYLALDPIGATYSATKAVAE